MQAKQELGLERDRLAPPARGGVHVAEPTREPRAVGMRLPRARERVGGGAEIAAPLGGFGKEIQQVRVETDRVQRVLEQPSRLRGLALVQVGLGEQQHAIAIRRRAVAAQQLAACLVVVAGPHELLRACDRRRASCGAPVPSPLAEVAPTACRRTQRRERADDAASGRERGEEHARERPRARLAGTEIDVDRVRVEEEHIPCGDDQQPAEERAEPTHRLLRLPHLEAQTPPPTPGGSSTPPRTRGGGSQAQ